MQKIKDNLATIITVLTLIGICFGAYIHFENKFATAEDVKQVSQTVNKVENRLDWKITHDQYLDTKKDMKSYEDQYKTEARMPEREKASYRKLQQQLEDLKLELDRLRKR